MVLALVCGQTAHSACVFGDYSVHAEYSRSDAVLEVVVVSERVVPDTEESDVLGGHYYTVRTEARYKGELPDVIDLFSENSSGRFPMVVGERYLVFVHSNVGNLTADNCGNSGRLSARQSIRSEVRRLADR